MEPGIQQPASSVSGSSEIAPLKLGGVASQAALSDAVARVESLPSFKLSLVYLGDTPLLSVSSGQEKSLSRASAITAQVNQLHWDKVPAESIKAVYDGRHYAVVGGQAQTIVTVDESIRLSRSVEFSLQETALQIANRLRRFLGDAPALKTVALVAVGEWTAGPIADSEANDDQFAEIGKAVAGAFQGVASWYGNRFLGRTTSSGQVYRSSDMIAAHRALPFGTQLRVTNLNNGRQVTVKVQDRGPFIRGRILDLSQRAAQVLGMMGTGVARVKVEVLK